jgi:hypothetical protein
VTVGVALYVPGAEATPAPEAARLK